MAARMTLNEAAASGRVDLAKVDATTEDDIARFHIEDSLELDETVAAPAEVLSPAEIRRRLGLTQAQLAERLDVPLRTWRNWEQGRVTLEPTVRVLLKLLSVDPEDVFRKLSGFRLEPAMAGHANRLVHETDAEVMARARVTSALAPVLEEEIARLSTIKTADAVDDIIRRTRASRS